VIKMQIQKLIRTYSFPIILIASILLGGLAGSLLGQDAQRLKPLRDIFLNLIFTTIVPLIFFSVSSAIARAGKTITNILRIISINYLQFRT